MSKKILFFSKSGVFHFILVLFFSLLATKSKAQCAGQDNSIEVCDIINPSSKSVDLSALLGAHTLGGIWNDDNLSGGLNKTTGILNAQLIRKSGTYTYTYSLNNVSGCTDSAIITVIIGGYAGVAAPNASVCSDDANFNLFQVFSGNSPSPQINGTWIDNDGTNALTDNFFNASIAGPGNYSFTYILPAIGTCSPQSSTINVSVFLASESGNPTDLKLCSDGLAAYTNFNLNELLTGEDDDGTWKEFGTSEITGPTDNHINIQNIYNSGGAGKYRFAYTVLSKNAICTDKTTFVDIEIEKQLDYTGATLVVNSDICENEIATARYTAVLTQGLQNIPNGVYDVIYTVSGVALPITITSNFNNGVLTFPIAATYFQQVGNYTVSILNIINKVSRGICVNIIPPIFDVLHVYPIPKINSATLKIDAVCQNFDALVEFSGTSNLTDGNYNILYNLSGSNTATAQSIDINVTGGIASFFIPAALIPNAGTTTFTITNITNLITNCTNTATLAKSFVINALPDVTNLVVTIKDVCINQPATVELSGLVSLTSISLSYILSGINNVAQQTLTLTVNSGKTSFTIPATDIASIGSTSFSITNLINLSNGCSAIINPNSKSFSIHALPNNPIVTDQEFCKAANATVASLIPNGTQYRWYNSATSTTALIPNTLLVSGNYYVKEVNPITGCESGLELAKIVINELSSPTLNQDGEKFCGLDNPTIQNLSDNVSSNGILVWFDAAVNGNQLSSTTLLQDNVIYYGFDSTTANSCLSTNPLQVTVSLTNCDVTSNFFIPDGFSPNGDGVNETFRIPDIDFLYPNYTLEIFNRYGNLMYTANRNKPDWDGSISDSSTDINGKAANGVYFYVINFNKGNTPPKQGRLYLNR
ncbi:gliding motility-associated C-terminal domain-containing protein [Flavobacterium sp. W1B]|uniref:gliding motility-associated C-terminal domain-containing protein n=1 Tax=Flavobacterium sp. W1B TaxID=3394146 RepID=UPI0039BD7053